jgi:hypothetical protein
MADGFNDIFLDRDDQLNDIHGVDAGNDADDEGDIDYDDEDDFESS